MLWIVAFDLSMIYSQSVLRITILPHLLAIEFQHRAETWTHRNSINRFILITNHQCLQHSALNLFGVMFKNRGAAHQDSSGCRANLRERSRSGARGPAVTTQYLPFTITPSATILSLYHGAALKLTPTD